MKMYDFARSAKIFWPYIHFQGGEGVEFRGEGVTLKLRGRGKILGGSNDSVTPPINPPL